MQKQHKQAACGYTLIELLIVIVILGIVASVSAPKFFNISTASQEGALKGTISHIRSALSVKYSANLVQDVRPLYPLFITADLFSDQNLPLNPVNHLSTIQLSAATGTNVILDSETDGSHGWVYQAESGEIRADIGGSDSNGIDYHTY